MKSTKRITIEPSVTLKDFASELVQRIEEGSRLHDVFSTYVGEIKVEMRKALLVRGSGTLKYLCSIGEYNMTPDGQQILQWKPINGEVTGKATALISLGAPIALAHEATVIQVASMTKAEAVEETYDSNIEEMCLEQLKDAIFSREFRNPGAQIKGVSISGIPEIESVQTILVPYYSCELRYRDIPMKASCAALAGCHVSLSGISELPQKAPEEDAIEKEARRIADMPKLATMLTLIPFLAMFYCIPMAWTNMKRDTKLFWILLSVGLAAMALVLVYAGVLLRHKHRSEAYRKAEFQKLADIRAAQKEAFVAEMKRRYGE